MGPGVGAVGYTIRHKVTSDMMDVGLWSLPGRLCCLYLVEMVKEG